MDSVFSRGIGRGEIDWMVLWDIWGFLGVEVEEGVGFSGGWFV